MNNGMIGQAMYLTWLSLGVEIDNIKESTEELVLYISVPKDTVAAHSISSTGDKMAGAYLAKRVKKTMTDMGVKRLTVKYKVRDEIWTEDKRKFAEESAKKEIYGSQW